jgi:hypothetical protein
MSVHGACDPVKLPPAKEEAHFDLKLPRDPMALLPLMSHYIRYRVPRWDTDTHMFVIRLQVPFHNLATLLLRQLVQHPFKVVCVSLGTTPAEQRLLAPLRYKLNMQSQSQVARVGLW